MADLPQLVHDLAVARATATQWRRDVTALKAEWLAEHVAPLRWLAAAERAETQAEAALRSAGLAAFEVDGNPKPTPGLTIKQRTVVEYEEAEALAWAQSSGLALKLDVKAFEKIAKATPIPCVTVRQEPMTEVASDLTPYLPIPEDSNAG